MGLKRFRFGCILRIVLAMAILELLAIHIFMVIEQSLVNAQLFEQFLFSTNSVTSSCPNHFISCDVIICGSFHQSLEIQVVSDGYQMAKMSLQDCYIRIYEFNFVEFKKTIFILNPQNDEELSGIVIQKNRLFNASANDNSTPLVIINWPSILVSQRDQNTLEKSLESVASYFLLHENVYIIYKRLLPDGSIRTRMLELFSIKNITFVQNVLYTTEYTSKLDCYIFTLANLRRNDFQGALIRATAVESEADAPVVTYGNNSENVEFTEGLGVFDLWDLRDILNFSIQAVKGESDISVENNTVTGIGRQLLDDEADVSILHSYTLLQTVRHLSPLFPLGADRVYAFFVQPPTSSVRDIFQKPFKSDLWATLLVAWLLIIFCVYTIGKVEKHIYKYDDDEDDALWPLKETNLWAVCVIGQRSFYMNPKTVAMRIVFLCGLYMSIITYTSYSAEIISSLTQETLPINSLHDLVHNKFKVISDPNMFYSSFLDKESSDEISYTTKYGSNYIDDVDATMSIANGRRMFFTTFDTLCLSAREHNYTDQKICSVFSKVPLGKVVLTSGFYVKKGCPFKEAFNSKLLIVMERGLNSRYISNYYLTTLVKCNKKTTSYRENLGMNDVFTAFLTLSIGFGISLTLLLLEKMWAQVQAGKNKRYKP